MKQRYGLLVALSALTVIVLLVVWLRSGSGDAGEPAAGSSTTGPSSEAPSESVAPEPSTSSEPPGPPPFKVKPLAPGERPPQFILFSFDGAGSTQKWAEFSAVAEPVNAHFTGFLSGVYLVPDSAKTAYTGPGHAPGKSSIGFGGTPEEIAALVATLNAGKAAGHEIGTHYNGHFCAGAEPSGKDWNADQWGSEIDQFMTFLQGYQGLAGIPGPPLTVTPADIKGGRTPCLEGNPDVLFPVLASRGLTYDSSRVSSGMVWPTLIHGIWEFWMPSVRIPATGQNVIAMDYNFWVRFNNAADEPARAPEFTAMVLETYRSMYAAAFAGNRAPLVIGNHFNNWSGNAFNPAVAQFMAEVCANPETVCTTYQTVLQWMSVQDPAILASLLAQPATFN